jgi:hypothetical protein
VLLNGIQQERSNRAKLPVQGLLCLPAGFLEFQCFLEFRSGSGGICTDYLLSLSLPLVPPDSVRVDTTSRLLNRIDFAAAVLAEINRAVHVCQPFALLSNTGRTEIGEKMG